MGDVDQGGRHGAGETRRSLLKKAGMVGGAVWIVPAVIAIDTPAAMASPGIAPVFKGAIPASGNFGANSIAFTGLETTFAVGDFMLAAVSVRVSTGKDVTIATPSGWSLVAGPVRSPATADGLRSYVFGRRFAAGDTAVTFTKSSNGNPTNTGGVIVGYTGVSAATPVVASSGNPTAATPATATGVTTTAINQKVVFVASSYANATWPLPTGFATFAARAEGPSDVDHPEVYVADATKATAGSTGNVSSAVTTTGTPTGLNSFLIALNP